MSTTILPEGNIPLKIHTLAQDHHVGSPLKRQRIRFFRLSLITIFLITLAALGWLLYRLYGYIAFTIMYQQYSSYSSVPVAERDNYLWLQVIHDTFWSLQTPLFILRICPIILLLISPLIQNRTQVYICSEGLLKTSGKNKVEAVRWDEIKESKVEQNKKTELHKKDGTQVTISSQFTSGKNNLLEKLIEEKLVHNLLPDLIERYERGEYIQFGTTTITHEGMTHSLSSQRTERSKFMLTSVLWRDVGAIDLARGVISLYYVPNNHSERTTAITNTFRGKWRTWNRIFWVTLNSQSNLPVMVALIKHILAQRQEHQINTAQLAQPPRTVEQTASWLKEKMHKRDRTIALTAITSIVVAFCLAISIPLYMAYQDNQTHERNVQQLRARFTERAHNTYTIHVPGQKCNPDSERYWYDRDTDDDLYICQANGLVMIQKNTNYTQKALFSFLPHVLNSQEELNKVHYFPHKYRVQVRATYITGEPVVCFGLTVHGQYAEGSQLFILCSDGYWHYSRNELHSNEFKNIHQGLIPHKSQSYLFAMEVSDEQISLIIDNEVVKTVYDNSFNSTDMVELEIHGAEKSKEPISVRFSDFTYQPLK